MSSKRFASAVEYLDSEDEDPNYWREIPEELSVYILGKMKDRAALRQVSMTDKLLHRHTSILYDRIVVSTREFYNELTRQLYADTPPMTFPEEGAPMSISWLTKLNWREFVGFDPDSKYKLLNMGGVIETIGKFLSSSELILEHLDLSALFCSFNTEMDPNVLPLTLSSALLVNDVLTTLNLRFNRIGDEGAVALGDALRGNGVLKTIDLRYNVIGFEGAAAIAEALRGNGVLKTLNLRNNYIGDAGATAIGEALAVNGVLIDLNLMMNEIGDEGATALASALRVNGGLKKINLSYNCFFGEGKGAIRDAVSGRVGFELEML